MLLARVEWIRSHYQVDFDAVVVAGAVVVVVVGVSGLTVVDRC